MSGDEDRARESGCDFYLSKPFDEDLLFAALSHFLARVP
jgi:CheY-like chemotaxis protein